MPPPIRRSILELLPAGAPEARPRGTVLFRQGDTLRQVVAIEAGVVKLVRSREDGTDLVVAVAAEGALVGLVAVDIDGEHDVAAECLTSCRVRSFAASHLEALAESSRALERALRHSLAADVRRRNHLLTLRGARSSEERFEALLSACSGAFAATRRPDGTMHVVFRVPKVELAAICDVAPQTFSQMLTDLEARGRLCRTPQGVLLPAKGARFAEAAQGARRAHCAKSERSRTDGRLQIASDRASET